MGKYAEIKVIVDLKLLLIEKKQERSTLTFVIEASGDHQLQKYLQLSENGIRKKLICYNDNGSLIYIRQN